MVMAPGALDLRPEEDLAEGLGRLFRLVAELHVKELRAVLLRQQQVAHPAIVRLVLGKLVGEPQLEGGEIAGRIRNRRIAAEDGEIPNGRLLRSKTWIIQQPLDQLVAFSSIRVIEELPRLLVGGNGADEV